MSYFFRTIPQNIALMLRDKYKLDTFVETGTYVGSTSKWASTHFADVYTIEFFEEHFRAAELKLANCKNVHMFLQDSLMALPGILATLETKNSKPLFYLDAHWSELAHYGKPLLLSTALEEVNILNSLYRHIDYAIVIDDAHKFGTDGWPLQEDMIDALEDNGKRTVRELLDVYIAVPKTTEEVKFALRRNYRDTYIGDEMAYLGDSRN